MTHPSPTRSATLGAATLLGACLFALLPFIDKAFHIDDPLFLWAARHIQSHPLDFYGFPVNWYGYQMPMSDVAKNPPLTSYYIALAAGVVGWSEGALHAAFLLPAAAAALGTYVLARRLCSQPLVAAMAAMLSPAFVVSSTNVMSDTMFLAFWVWSMALWMRGLERQSGLALAGAALLMALAALTKYFGIALLPLLSAYALARRVPPRSWAPYLSVPVGAVIAYHSATLALYGYGPFVDAMSYSVSSRQGQETAASALTGLSFAGGGLLGLAAYAPLLWPRRALALALAVVALLMLLVSYAGSMGSVRLHDAGGVRWALVIQLGICVAAGVQLVALAVADAWEHRDADVLLLVCWVVGTFVFAAFLNWTVSARALLPMAPAAGILLVRRLDRRAVAAWAPRWLLVCLLLPGMAIAMAAASADYQLAGAAKTAARVARGQLGDGSARLWFQGHWGFQVYMEAVGAWPMDWRHTPLAPGDLVVVPAGNTNQFPLPATGVVAWRVVEVPLSGIVTPMSGERGAGFYSSLWGPLPIAFGPVPPDRYYLYQVVAGPDKAR